jgi:hypothetical protein
MRTQGLRCVIHGKGGAVPLFAIANPSAHSIGSIGSSGHVDPISPWPLNSVWVQCSSQCQAFVPQLWLRALA